MSKALLKKLNRLYHESQKADAEARAFLIPKSLYCSFCGRNPEPTNQGETMKQKPTFKSVALELARREKGRTEINIAQIRSLLRHLAVLCVKDPRVISVLIARGAK